MPGWKTPAADEFPVPLAGVVTTYCECGWEIISIIPEEHERRLALILMHLVQVHGLKMPVMNFYAH